MVEKEGIKIVIIFTILLVFAAIVILFLISTGVASSLLGGMPLITSVVTIILALLGIKR